jgi:hypothetical protein
LTRQLFYKRRIGDTIDATAHVYIIIFGVSKRKNDCDFIGDLSACIILVGAAFCSRCQLSTHACEYQHIAEPAGGGERVF